MPYIRKISRIKRIVFFLSIIFLVVAALPVYLFVVQPNSVIAEWFNDNWAYRVPVTITNASEVANQTANVAAVDTATLVTAGKMQTDCGDSVWTDAQGKMLQYVIVSGCNSSNTTYQILVPTINNGSTVLYHYYGNPASQNMFQTSLGVTNCSGCTSALGSEEKAPGPISYWNFDEGVGSTANDYSEGSNNDLTITNAVWRDETYCLPGTCLFFDGTGDYAAKTYASDSELDPGTGSFTVSTWFRHSSATPGADQFIVARYITSGTPGGYKIYMNTSAQMCFGIDDDATWGPDDAVCSTGTYADSAWHQLTAVKVGTTSIAISIDGQASKQIPVTATGSISGTSPVFNVGIDTGQASGGWVGNIDELKYYNFAKNASQLLAEFASRSTPKGTSVQFGDPEQQTYLSNGLIGYWKMDEATWGAPNCSANVTSDASGNGLNLIACPTTTGPVGGNVGKFGNGVTFDGSDDALQSSNATLAFNGEVTVSAWVNITANGTTTAKYIVDKTQTNKGFALYHDHTTAVARFRIGNGTAYADTSAGSTLSTGTWYHLVGTADSAGRLKIYVNGTLDGTGGSSSAMQGNSAKVFEIGARSVQYFNGTADEVRVFNRALTDRDVQNLYAWGPGPIGWWKFDNNTGQTASDESGNGNSVTLGANTTADVDDPKWVPGRYGSALNFDGIDDLTLVSDPGVSALDITNQLTITAWIYKTGNTVNGGWADMVVKGNTGASAANYWFQIIDDSNVEYLDFYLTDGGAAIGEIRSNTPLSLNQWTHVGVTKNDITDSIAFYINGVVQVGTTNILGTVNTTDMVVNDSDFKIGFTYPGQMFPGYMDDVRVYNYARTPSQIIEDMNGGHPAPGSPVGSYAGYWNFDQGSGTTAYDSSINQKNLTVNASDWSLDGKFGGGLIAGRVARDASVDNTTQGGVYDFSATDDFTLSSWAKSSSITNPGAIEAVVAKGEGEPGYSLYFNTSGQACMGIDDDATFDPDVAVCSQADFYDSSWHHILGVRDVVADKVLLYVDGIMRSSSTDTTTATLDNADSLRIGQRIAADGDDEFQGLIDDVKIYRFALTGDQAKIEYNRGATTSLGSLSTLPDGYTATNSATSSFCIPGDTGTCRAPVGYWRLDDNTGNITTDSSGFSNTGTLTNGPLWRPGKISQSVNFDGVNDYISIPYNANQDPTANMTIGFWFNSNRLINSAAVSGTTLGLISKANTNTDANNDWQFSWFDTHSGRMRFGTYGDNIQTITSAWDAGAWYHIEAVVTNTNTANIYVNGKLDTYNSDTDISTNPINGDQNTILNVGLTKTIQGDFYFKGIIDDVRFYDYSRSPAQIAWDYNRGEPIALYKFDECQGTTAYNAVISANNEPAGANGSITIGASDNTYTVAGACGSGTSNQSWNGGTTGKRNSSLGFGGDEYVTVSTLALPTDDFTIGAWIYSANISSEYIIWAGDGSGTDELSLRTSASDTITVNVNASDLAGNTVLANNTWYHLVGTRKGSTVTVYVNGVGDELQFEPLLLQILSHFNKLMELYQSGEKEEDYYV